MKRLNGCIAGALLLVAGQTQAKDWMWEITTRMEMPGMPKMAGIPGMGAQKNTSCIAEGKEAEASSKQQPDCKVTDTSTSGKISRMTIQCKEGTMKMEHEQIGPEHWRARMETVGGRKGEQMTIHTEARRLGPCDAAKDGTLSKEMQGQLGEQSKMAKGHAEMLGKECQDAVKNWPGNAEAFSRYDQMAKQRQDMLSRGKGPDAMKLADASAPEVPQCGAAKADYCAKTRAAYGELGNRKGYADVMKRAKSVPGAVNKAFAYCGAGDPAQYLAGHCKSAVSESDYGFIAGFCPEDRKVLAKQHCAGRSYTAIEAKYRALCGGGGGGDSGEASRASGKTGTTTAAAAGSRKQAQAEQPAPPKPEKDLQTQAVEEGVKALKGFLKF